MRTNEIPLFGCLQGIRVVHLTQSIGGSYGAERLAEFGADVIWVENPRGIDLLRTTRWGAEQERKNMRSICLDPVCEEGRKVFFRLLKTADVLIDCYRGGQMAKWGITDDIMLGVNPGLIIDHVSGMGQTGDPAYSRQPGADMIAQAFGCYMIQNGFPDRKPVPAFPYVGGYITALFSAFAVACALYRREKTGKGEVIDVAQYEVMMSVQGQQVSTFLNTGALPVREGNMNPLLAGCGLFECKDGRDVYMALAGSGVTVNALKLFGLAEDPDFQPLGQPMYTKGTPGGDKFQNAVIRFCSSHTAEELEKAFIAAGLPVSRVFSYEDAVENPQYRLREVFTEWENTRGDRIRGVNIFPKMCENRNRIWRGLMDIGEDTGDILEELGYSADEIKALADAGIALKTTLR